MSDGSAIAEKYWQAAFWDTLPMMARGMGEEGAPDEPLKFKSYLGAARRGLPQRVPASVGPVEAAFGHTNHAGPAELGDLLYYSYGLSRIDVGVYGGWPFHRVVPSARCFYPTELYVVLPGEGVFHYDQAHHSLVRIRPGYHLATLAAATGADLSGARAVVVLTSHLWKTAFKYRHYAYRLCSQEAGMVAGNVLMVASALGHPGHLHLQFLDEVVDRLLGLRPGEERAVAVIPLYDDAARRPRTAPAPRRAGDLLAGLAPVHVPYRDVAKDLSLADDVYRLDAASVLHDTADFAPPAASARLTAEPPGAAGGADLATALRVRNSGGSLFRPVPGPIDVGALDAMLRYAMAPLPGDLGDRPQCTVHHVVQNVDGWPAGVYCGRERVADLPRGRLDLDVSLGPPVFDPASVNVFCYVVADRRAAGERWGARGFRIANMDAGVVAQRLAVLAAAGGLAARVVNGYSTPDIQRLLRLDDPAQTPIFQLMVGRRSPSPQYEMPIVF